MRPFHRTILCEQPAETLIGDRPAQLCVRRTDLRPFVHLLRQGSLSIRGFRSLPLRAVLHALVIAEALRSMIEPMKARVFVTLKDGILDPQGKAIEGALKSLGINGVESVRQGKIFDIELKTDDRIAAQDLLREACEKLLANEIVENFQVEIL
jgi:phosphoribosylformylglycinamidine synthase subunit PurS